MPKLLFSATAAAVPPVQTFPVLFLSKPENLHDFSVFILKLGVVRTLFVFFRTVLFYVRKRLFLHVQIYQRPGVLSVPYIWFYNSLDVDITVRILRIRIV